MNNTIYIALSKQTAQFRQMSVIANNIANVNTGGYRAERMLFDEYLTNGGNRLKLSFTHDVGTATDEQAGAITATDRQLDVAITGKGFFVVQTPAGLRYTRAGNLVVASNGTLSTQQGYPVLNADNQPITLQPEDTDILIRENGLITVNGDDRGVLNVVAFPNEQVLEKAGQSLYRTTAQPQPAENFQVVQGVLEGSNVNSVAEMTNMITVTRSVSRTAELIKDINELERKAVKAITEIV